MTARLKLAASYALAAVLAAFLAVMLIALGVAWLLPPFVILASLWIGAA